jgi:hypothetical protein
MPNQLSLSPARIWHIGSGKKPPSAVVNLGIDTAASHENE